MSLSEQNRALIDRVFSKARIHTEDTFPVTMTVLCDLLDAARAEGVAALQQAGEPVKACIEDIKAGLCCPRPQGCEQNDSEYCLVRQAFARAGLIADPSSPLPQQTALVEQGVEE